MTQHSDRLKLLVIAPSLDGSDVGEVYNTFHWIKAIARKADVTVLASSRRYVETPLAEQLPEARVVTWPELPFLYERMERLNAQAKPGFSILARQVRRWLREALARGETFDIAHQMLPKAMRHGTPLRHFDIPYVMGPLGGGLETPEAFRDEVHETSSLAIRMRQFDTLRRRWDPALRESFRKASLLLGPAAYIGEILAPLGIARFEIQQQIGRRPLPPQPVRQMETDRIELLHVGRTVRTKGLRDTIRAMGQLQDLPGIRLTVAGDGEDMASCRAEADALGVADRITFLGRKPRAEIDALYAAADVFCFPSFREPLGGVLYEAMSFGLPIITAARGGPDSVVDDTCGIRVPVTEPQQFSRDIAAAIRKLAGDPELRQRLGQGGREKYIGLDDWDGMADRMLELYHEILSRPAKRTTA